MPTGSWIGGIRTGVADRILLDTGVLVALSNRADPDHERCRAACEGLRAQLLSVEGVLIEAALVLRRTPGGPRAAFELARRLGTTFIPASGSILERSVALMERYRNVPMDLVDALLVAVAEE